MYEESENKIQWGLILKRALIIVGVLLVVIGIIALVSRCTKDDDKPKPDEPTKVNLETQLDELERATLEYLTKDNLPTELNASKTIRLKILINRNLTQGITDSENNTCDTSESYSEVTRLENNYAVKMSLSCGKNKESRVIYVGCFENCNGGICKGEESQTGGVCGSTTTPVVDNKTDNPEPTNPIQTDKPSSSNNNNTNTNKPNNNNNSNNNNNNNNNNTITVKPGLPQGLLYEHKKCTQEKVCEYGTMNANGECLVYGNVTLEGRVLRKDNPTSSTYKEKATSQTQTTTVKLTYAQAKAVKNNPNYKLQKVNVDGTYTYTKTETVNVCKGNVKPTSDGWCYYTNTTSTPSFECEDKTYTYDKNTGKCTKKTYQVTNIIPPVLGKEVCETTWSYSNYIEGWTFTGSVK